MTARKSTPRPRADAAYVARAQAPCVECKHPRAHHLANHVPMGRQPMMHCDACHAIGGYETCFHEFVETA